MSLSSLFFGGGEYSTRWAFNIAWILKATLGAVDFNKKQKVVETGKSMHTVQLTILLLPFYESLEKDVLHNKKMENAQFENINYMIVISNYQLLPLFWEDSRYDKTPDKTWHIRK